MHGVMQVKLLIALTTDTLAVCSPLVYHVHEYQRLWYSSNLCVDCIELQIGSASVTAKSRQPGEQQKL